MLNTTVNYDASRKDVIDYIVQTCFQNGHYWVDENNYLRIRGQQSYRNTSCTAYYRQYGDLVLSENRSYDDSGFYNCVNVVSKVTFDGVEYTFFGRAYNPLNTQATNYRVLYIEDNTLQSNEECYTRAMLEAWNQYWGHETFTVELQDNYLPFLYNPSTVVGTSVEYKTGVGKSISCLITKISFSSGKITLNLKPFKPINYAALEKQYDGLFKPNLTGQQTLASPQIVGHRIYQADDGRWYARLYVEGDDIEYGILRAFDFGSTVPDVENPDYEDRLRGLGGEFIAKENGVRYVDVPITENKTYKLYVQLFSPLFEDSALSSTIQNPVNDNTAYVFTVTEIVTPEPTDTDPYPHPIMPMAKYLNTENNETIVNENDDKIYVQMR